MANDIVIKVENLCKRYNLGELHNQTNSFRDKVASFFKKDGRSKKVESIWALKDVSFEVKKGEILGIIGPNGAGKSTLLKILSRITKPTSGKALINGRVGSLLEVGTGFHPELTGRENIYLNGSILGIKKDEISKKFDEIVAFAEIDKFIDTPVKRYSSGMYVRLAFAVAAHMQPEILLVDEVLAVGDIAFQKKCLWKMDDTAKLGRTVLFVSHNMSSIRNLCERVIWIDSGQIKRIGPAYEVIRDYEEKQLKSFDKFSSISSRDLEEVKDLNFYINQVMMTNSSGENTNVFLYNQSMVLILELHGEPEEKRYGIEFKIFKDTGEFACTGTSGILHGVYFDRSVKKVQIDIGPLTLTKGKYNILLSIMYNKKRTDIWRDACCFHIVECYPFALPQEIRTPVCVIQHSFHAADRTNFY